MKDKHKIFRIIKKNLKKKKRNIRDCLSYKQLNKLTIIRINY